MRVISGTAGRLPLDAPKSVARPSTDRLREALFSILGPGLVDARVLDLFAGSGALGIEALSRGAQQAVFVDADRAAIRAIESNLKRTRLGDQARVVNRDVYAWLKQASQQEVSFDLIFADPPYLKREGDTDHVVALLAGPLVQLLAPGGQLVVETASAEPPSNEKPWSLCQSRHYGRSHLHFYQLSE